jgi:hypothetical protein
VTPIPLVLVEDDVTIPLIDSSSDSFVESDTSSSDPQYIPLARNIQTILNCYESRYIIMFLYSSTQVCKACYPAIQPQW